MDNSAPSSHNQSKKLLGIAVMMVVTVAYSLAELGVAVYFGALVLMADGLHNLSDALTLAVSYWAERKKFHTGSTRLTFGWRRSEVLGGFFNGMFLVSMAIFIAIEAIAKFVNPDHMSSTGNVPFIVLAAVKIAVNILASIVFHGHSHSHGHGHGGHGHDSKRARPEAHGHGHGETSGRQPGNATAHAYPERRQGSPPPLVTLAAEAAAAAAAATTTTMITTAGEDEHAHNTESHEPESRRDINMWGVYVHFLGDIFTSILVLFVGLVYRFAAPSVVSCATATEWVDYMDPLASILSAFIIFATAFPVVKSSSWILLQSAPKHIDRDALSNDLLKVPNIKSVHEMHVWQLVDGVCVGSVHIVISPNADAATVMEAVKRIFHQHGVHSTSIQHEKSVAVDDLPIEDQDDEQCHGANLITGKCVEGCLEERCCPRKRMPHSFSMHSETSI